MPYHSALFVLFLNLQALTHLKSGLATQLYNYSWVAVPKNKEVLNFLDGERKWLAQ